MLSWALNNFEFKVSIWISETRTTISIQFFETFISTCMPITVIAYKKMFYRMKFLAPTCYKGCHKYIYFNKDETGKIWGFHDSTDIFGVYTCILECGYDLASYILGDTCIGNHCWVADTHLVLDIPTLWMKVEGDVEAKWVSMESWQVGGTMLWLWLPQQCWESNPYLNVDKYPKHLLWILQILHHVAFATYICTRVFKRLVFSMQSWVKDCWVLCTLCCSFVVSWPPEAPDG